MKVKVGYADDGFASRKYRLIGKIEEGKYIVIPYNKVTILDGTSYLADGDLQIVDKLLEIHEEEI